MPVFNEGRYPGEFLLTEANGQRSRATATIVSGSGIIAPGTVLGRLTASGNYAPSPDTGADGSEIAVAIALYGCDATSADRKIAVITRDAEVKGPVLTFDPSVDDDTKRAAKAAQLAAAGIIVR